MNHGTQNSTGNQAAAAPQRTDPVVFANSNGSGKQGREDNDTGKVDNRKKRPLPQEAKQAKRMKEVTEELGCMGEELKLFNAASSSFQSEIIEIRMVQRKIARQEELMVDILDAIEEGDSVKVDELVQILFSI